MSLRPTAALFSLSVLVLGGCFTRPVAVSNEEFAQRMNDDLAFIESRGDPIDHPLQLDDAISRALNHNLDLQLEMRRKALSQRELELSHFEMLPTLVGNLGWNKRNNLQAATSRSYATDEESLEASYSQPRSLRTSDLRLSWNVLDFGVGWVRAHQAADRVMIADEEKRKVAQQMTQDVRGSYWRAVSAERLMHRAMSLEERVDHALANSREVGRRKLTAPLTALTYERELIGIQRELQKLQRELAVSKIQLAALTNVRPGRNFQVAVPETRTVREIGMTLRDMEEYALLHRPEVRTLAYEDRINEGDSTAALFELLPRVEVFVGGNHSDNNLLVNKDWVQYGANVSYGLIRVFSLPRTLAKIEAKKELLLAQRRAMTMAVLSQVHVSRAMWEQHRREYATADDYLRSQLKILEQVRASAGANRVGEQTLIREEMNTLVAEVRRDLAYADLESAHGAILLALGVEPDPDPGAGMVEAARTLSANAP